MERFNVVMKDPILLLIESLRSVARYQVHIVGLELITNRKK